MTDTITEIIIDFTDYIRYAASFDAEELQALIEKGVITKADVENVNDDEDLTEKLIEYLRERPFYHGDYDRDECDHDVSEVKWLSGKSGDPRWR